MSMGGQHHVESDTGPTIEELIEAIKADRPKPPVGEGETAVFDLGDGRQVVVRHWPSAALAPEERWQASIRTSMGQHTPPLDVVRVEEGT